VFLGVDVGGNLGLFIFGHGTLVLWSCLWLACLK